MANANVVTFAEDEDFAKVQAEREGVSDDDDDEWNDDDYDVAVEYAPY